MDSNYPLVRLKDAGGTNFYARTYNWSSTGVQTGGELVSTEAKLPLTLGNSPYSLFVVANGISSDPVTFYPPVWVDFNYTGANQFGTYTFPDKTLAQGTNSVHAGGAIAMKGNSSAAVTAKIGKAMTLTAIGGPVTIGR
jgi:hypothetical protein